MSGYVRQCTSTAGWVEVPKPQVGVQEPHVDKPATPTRLVRFQSCRGHQRFSRADGIFGWLVKSRCPRRAYVLPLLVLMADLSIRRCGSPGCSRQPCRLGLWSTASCRPPKAGLADGADTPPRRRSSRPSMGRRRRIPRPAIQARGFCALAVARRTRSSANESRAEVSDVRAPGPGSARRRPS
jgi:hypothetical protein